MSAEPQIILHIAPRVDWERAKAAGEYRAPSLESEGFIHFSTPSQVIEVANALYAERDDLVLLVVNPGQLTAPLRWEAPIGGGDTEPAGPFPHLYGPLPVEAVATAVEFAPGPEGAFTLPDTVIALLGGG